MEYSLTMLLLFCAKQRFHQTILFNWTFMESGRHFHHTTFPSTIAHNTFIAMCNDTVHIWRDLIAFFQNK